MASNGKDLIDGKLREAFGARLDQSVSDDTPGALLGTAVFGKSGEPTLYTAWSEWATQLDGFEQDSQAIKTFLIDVSTTRASLEGRLTAKLGRAWQKASGMLRTTASTRAPEPMTRTWQPGQFTKFYNERQMPSTVRSLENTCTEIMSRQGDRLLGKGSSAEQATLAFSRLRNIEHGLQAQQALVRSLVSSESARSATRLADMLKDHLAICGALPASGVPWDWDGRNSWQTWQPPSVVTPVYRGAFQFPSGELTQLAGAVDSPVNLKLLESEGWETVDFRGRRGMSWWPEANRVDDAKLAAQAMILRLLAAVPPGKARFTFIDPLGMGNNVAPFLELAEYDPSLVDTKAWCQHQEISAKLAELNSHLELVIQKYLMGRFETIEDYNAEAGEVAEPYRFVFIFDFPSQFDDQTFHQLMRLVENGSRCGIYTFLVNSPKAPAAHGVDVERALSALDLRILLDDERAFKAGQGRQRQIKLSIDRPPELRFDRSASAANTFTRVIRAVGELGKGTDDVIVEAERVNQLLAEAQRSGVRRDLPATRKSVSYADPSTWWTGSSASSIGAAIGRASARDVAMLTLDTEILSGALLVGRPGSGKTTLLHAAIMSLVTQYGPDELELYLLDFKEGVEFKSYGTLGLPHARCVAVESEREFGLSVLQSVADELERRGSEFRALGGETVNIVDYRAKTGKLVPRVVVIIDEFHELFSRADKVGIAAGELIEKIIRQGRGFGIHVILGSQSLANLDAVGSHVFRLLPIRMVLPCAGPDAVLALGDSNNAAAYLTRRGEGIINNSGGNPEANVRFQGTYLSTDDRLLLLRALRERADATGFTRRPVVYEGQSSAEMDIDAAAFVASVLSGPATQLVIPVGLPTTLGPAVRLDMRREAGNNVIFVSRDSSGLPQGFVGVALSALVAQAARASGVVEIANFMPPDDGYDELIEPHLGSGVVRLSRPREISALLGRVKAEVERRVDGDLVREPPHLVVLSGVHRARDLDADVSQYDEDETALATKALDYIARNGPEFGVHLVAWADSVTGVERRMSRAARREFSWRVAGTMSPADSVNLFDDETAATLRPNQVYVQHLDRGSGQRVRAFGAPSRSWVENVAGLV